MKLYQKCKDWLIGDYIAKQQDIYQQSKAILLFNVSFLVFIVMIPLLAYILATGLYGKVFPSLLGLVFVIVQVLLFKRYQNIWWSSFVLCFLTSMIVCVNINFNDQALHLVEPFWMIVIVVFAVFMIGVKWGAIICLILLTGFSFFVVNKLESNLRDFLDLIPTIKYFLIAE
ncbi:MAG: hypothetical protein HYZ43_08895, partial [Flavobacteriia bacterium]|nr:hypothetical protein [Flavobacteriia bacterium]